MPSRRGLALFVVVLAAGLAYIVFHVFRDLDAVKNTGSWPYMLLGLALLIALGFEFVNGFHDTANAVATVIYTNSLEPHVAVVWSGVCNLAGCARLPGAGAVAFAISASPCCRSISSSRSAPAPASPWSLPCSSRPSCGI